MTMTITTTETANGGGATRVTYVEPAAGEVVDALGDVATFKLTTADTGGSLILVEVVTPPGGGPPGLHSHPPREAFYVLEGQYEVSGMGEDGKEFTVRATPGSVIYVPPGAPHNFKNVGATPGRLLIVYTSPAMERFPRELAAVAAESAPGDQPDPARVAAVLAKYEVSFVDPAPESA